MRPDLSSMPKGRQRQSCRTGTVLMECVLVLPLLTALIFAVVQFSLIWYAQIMTHYAAYNAARAALVYHPGEYRDSGGDGGFLPKSGPCWRAACQTLSWVSSSPNRGKDLYQIPGCGEVPSSYMIEDQVRISTSSSEGEGWVKVRVEFDFPLHVPVIGKMIAFAAHAEDAVSTWQTTGWQPSAEGSARIHQVAEAHPLATDYITLHARSMLAKPWSTARFARVPQSER